MVPRLTTRLFRWASESVDIVVERTWMSAVLLLSQATMCRFQRYSMHHENEEPERVSWRLSKHRDGCSNFANVVINDLQSRVQKTLSGWYIPSCGDFLPSSHVTSYCSDFVFSHRTWLWSSTCRDYACDAVHVSAYGRWLRRKRSSKEENFIWSPDFRGPVEASFGVLGRFSHVAAKKVKSGEGVDVFFEF